MSDRGKSSRLLASWAIPVVLIAGAAVFAVMSFGGVGGNPADPLAVRADGPQFETVEELIEASQLIVEGTVVAVDDGRSISDPTNPEAGIRTALARLDIVQVLKGAARDVVIVEQEAALLDDTPIVVNGLQPNEVGQLGFWFLVDGPSDDFPYVALVNEQARVLLSEGALIGSDLVSNLSVEQFRERLGDCIRHTNSSAPPLRDELKDHRTCRTVADLGG